MTLKQIVLVVLAIVSAAGGAGLIERASGQTPAARRA